MYGFDQGLEFIIGECNCALPCYVVRFGCGIGFYNGGGDDAEVGRCATHGVPKVRVEFWVYYQRLPRCCYYFELEDLVDARAIQTHGAREASSKHSSQEAEARTRRIGEAGFSPVGCNHHVSDLGASSYRSYCPIFVEPYLVQASNVDQETAVAQAERIRPAITLALNKKRYLVLVAVPDLLT